MLSLMRGSDDLYMYVNIPIRVVLSRMSPEYSAWGDEVKLLGLT